MGYDVMGTHDVVHPPLEFLFAIFGQEHITVKIAFGGFEGYGFGMLKNSIIKLSIHDPRQ